MVVSDLAHGGRAGNVGTICTDGGYLGADDGFHSFLMGMARTGGEEIGREQGNAHNLRRGCVNKLVLGHEDVVDGGGVVGGFHGHAGMKCSHELLPVGGESDLFSETAEMIVIIKA